MHGYITFGHFINTTAYHLDICEPSSPSTKELRTLINEIYSNSLYLKNTQYFKSILQTFPKWIQNQANTIVFGLLF